MTPRDEPTPIPGDPASSGAFPSAAELEAVLRRRGGPLVPFLVALGVAAVAVMLAPPAWALIPLAAIVAARFSTSLAPPGRLLAVAILAGVCAFAAAMAWGSPLVAIPLAACSVHGACLAAGWTRGLSAGARAYIGAAAFFAMAFSATLAADSLRPADSPTVDAQLAAHWRGLLERARALPDATTPPMPPDQAGAWRRLLDDFDERFDHRFLAQVWIVIYMILANPLSWALGTRRHTVAELATFRATDRQMPLVIVALALRLLAPRVGEGELMLLAQPLLYGVGALLWLQALGMMAWVVAMARIQRQKLLYFVSLLGAGLLVFVPILGVLLGLSDVYLDFRKPRQARGDE